MSFAFLARDAIFNRVQAMPFFSGFKFAKTKAFPVQIHDIPYCGIYFINETLIPDGNANMGEVRFRATTVIGFSVIIANNDPVVAETKLDQAYDTLMDNLLNDLSLYDGNLVKIQAFPNGSRSHVFGDLNAANESPIAELRMQLGVDLGTITYPPVVPDVFETMHVETRYPKAWTDPNEIQQLTAQYDILQNDPTGSKLHGAGKLRVQATVI